MCFALRQSKVLSLGAWASSAAMTRTVRLRLSLHYAMGLPPRTITTRVRVKASCRFFH